MVRLQWGAGGTTAFNISSQTVNFSNHVDLTNLDTFTVTGSTVIFDGSSTVTSSGQKFNDIQIGTGGVVTVEASGTIEIDGDLTFGSGGTTTLDISDDVLILGGDATMGNLDNLTESGSTVIFDGSGTLFSAGQAFNDIQIGSSSAGADLKLVDNLDVNGSITVTNGGSTVFDVTNQTINAAANINLTNMDTFTVTGSMVLFDGDSTVTSAGQAFNNFRLGTNAIVRSTGNLDIDGTLDVSGAGTETLVISDDTLFLSGNAVLTGLDTFTVDSSTITIDGTSSITSASQAVNNLTIGTASASGFLTLADNANIDGNLSFGAASPTTITAPSRTINLAGNADFSNMTSGDISGSTFVFDGNSTVTSAGLVAFNDIQIDANGTLIAGDSLDVNGDFTVNSGAGSSVFTITNQTVSLAGDVSLVNLDTFNSGGSIVVFDGDSTASSVSTVAFNKVQIAAGGTLRVGNSLNIDGDFTVGSASATYFNISNRTIDFGADVDFTSLDTFVRSGSKLVFDGDGTLTSSGFSLNDIQIGGTDAGGGIIRLDGTLDLNGDLTVTDNAATSFYITNEKVFASADIDLTGLDTFETAGSTVIFDGSSTVDGGTVAFNNFQIGSDSVGANVSSDGTSNINGSLTVTNSGSTYLDISGDNIYAASTVTLTNLDSFTVTGSTVIFDGDSTLTSAGYPFNNIAIGSDSAGGTLNLADTLDINGTVTVGSANNTILNLTNDTVYAAGNVTLTNLDTLTKDNSTVIFDGTVSLTSASKTFNHIQIGSSSTNAVVTTEDNLAIAGNLSVGTASDSTFDISTDTVTAAGNFDLANLGGFVITDSTMTFNGSATVQTVSSNSFTYNTITVTNTGTTIFDEEFTTEDFTAITAGSKLRFQQESTFTLTGTLTLTGEASSEIDIDSVDGGSQFCIDTNKAQMAIDRIRLKNSNAASNDITAYNSINAGGNDDGDPSPHWVFFETEDIDIAVGQITLTGSTTVSESSLGFTPKAYVILMTANDNEGVDSSGKGMMSVGMTDGNRQFCASAASADGVRFTDVDRVFYTDAVACSITTSGADVGKASHSSFDAGTEGFSVVIDTEFTEPSNNLAQYIALGGDALSVYVDATLLSAAVDSSIDIKDMTFEPDVVLTAYAGDVDLDSGSMSLGWAVNSDNQTTGETQVSATICGRDNLDSKAGTGVPTETVSRFDNAYAGGSCDAAIAADASFEIGSFDGSGFSVTTRLVVAAGGTSDMVGYMALKLGTSPYVFSDGRTARTSAGEDQVLNAGFKPIFMMGIGNAVATTVNSYVDGGSLSVGIIDADSERNPGTDYAMYWFDQDNKNEPTNSNSQVDDDVFIRAAGNTGTVDWEASVKSYDGSGWTLNYDSDGAASAAYYNAFLAIGLIPAVTSVTGTVYEADGATAIVSGPQVSLAIDGVIQQSVDADGSGVFTMNVTVSADDVLTVFIDDASAEYGVAVTVADGNPPLTLNIFQDHLIARQDNGGSLTNTNLTTAADSGDSNITAIYSMSGNNLHMVKGKELLIPLNHTLSLNGDASIDSLDINGTFTMNAQTVTASGTWDATGGTFTSTGTVRFDGTNCKITSDDGAGDYFTNIQIGTATDGATVTTMDNMDIDGNLTVANGGTTIFNVSGDTIYIGGNLTLTNLDQFTQTGSTFVFDNSTSLTSSGFSFNNVQIGPNAGGSSLTTADDMDINGSLTVSATGNTTFDIANDTVYASSTFNLTNLDTLTVTPSSTILFDGSLTATMASKAAYKIQVGSDSTAGTVTFSGDVDVDSELSGGSVGGNQVTVGANTLYLKGTLDLSNYSGFITTGSTLLINGDATATTNGFSYNDVTLDQGTLVTQDDIDINGNLLVNNTGDTYLIASDDTMYAAGNVTFSFLDGLTSSNATVVFDGTSDFATGDEAFNNIKIGSDTTGASVSITAGYLDINGDLTVGTGGNTTLNITSDEVKAAGAFNLTNLDTFTVAGSTVIFDGDSTLTSSGNTFNNVEVGEVGVGAGILKLADTMDINGTLTVSSTGSTTLTITDNTLSCASTFNLTGLDNFNSTGSTVVLDGALTMTHVEKTFNNLTIGTSTTPGAVTVGDTNLDIDGVFSAGSVGGNTFNLNSQTVYAAGDFNLNDVSTFTSSNSTVVFDGDSSVTSNGESFNIVTIGANGTMIASDTTDIDGAFSVTAGGTSYVSISGQTVNVSGATFNLTNLNQFITTGSTMIFDGNCSLTSSSHALNDVQIDTNVTLTPADTMDIDGNFSIIGSGTEVFNITSRIINVAGNMNLSSLDTLTIGASSTVMFDGNSTLTTNDKTFNHIQIGSAATGGNLITTGDLDINGHLTVSAAGSTTFNIAGDTVNSAGDFDMSELDTFTTDTSSVVIFDGSGTQTVSSNSLSYQALTVTNASAGGVIFAQDFTTVNFTDSTAGSRLTFQQDSTFNITDTLSLIGASSSEVILDSADGASRFTLNVTAGPQNVSYVNVSNSQASSNNITATGYIDGGNCDEDEGVPHWIFVDPPGVRIATGQFELSAGTGNQEITGVGFQPKGYVLLFTNNASDNANSNEGDGNGSQLSVGMTDGTRQFCMVSGSEDNQATSDVGRRAMNDKVLCDIDMGDDDQTDVGEAQHSSFGTDGFTINRTTEFTEPASADVHYIAFGGDDISVYADSTTLEVSQSSSVDVSEVNFEPDLVLTSFVGNFEDSAGDDDNDDASFSLGWAINPDVRSSDNQYSIMIASQDGQVVSSTVTRLDDTRAGTSYRDGAIDASFQITAFDSSGFSVTTVLADATVNEIMGYLALDISGTAQVFSTTRTTLESTGDDQDANAQFQPIFLMGIGSAVATTANVNTPGGSLVIGIIDEDYNGYSMAIHDENTAATTNTHTRYTSTQFMRAFNNAGTIDWDATVSSLDNSGWTLTYGDAASDAYINAFLAIGVTAASESVSGNVYYDEGVTAMGAGVPVSISVNGSNALQTVQTNASGKYAFTIGSSNGDVLTVYTDGTTAKAVCVMVSDGAATAFNTHIYEDYLILRDKAGSGITNTHLTTADDNGDADITAVYSMSGNTLNMVDDTELLIPSGITFSLNGDATVDNIDINGTLTMNAQTVTASGTWDATGGAFTSTSGTVVFDGTSNVISDSAGADAFFNVQIGTGSLGGVVTTMDTIYIDGTVSVGAGGATTFDISDDTAEVGGHFNLTNLDTFTTTSATVILDGTSTLTSADLSFNNLQIGNDAAGVNVSLDGTLDINGHLSASGAAVRILDISDETVYAAGNFNLSNVDTFTSSNSTVIFDGDSTLTSNSKSFNIVQIAANGTLRAVDDANIDGEFTIASGGTTYLTIDGVTVSFADDVNLTNLDTFVVSGSTLTFDGDSTLTSNDLSLNNIQIGASSGSVGGILHLDGTADINGNLSVTNQGTTEFHLNSQSVFAAGDFILTNLDSFGSSSSTVLFDGDATVTGAGHAFNDVVIGATPSSVTVSTGGNLDINGSLSVSNAGSTTLDISDDTINAASNVILTGLDTFTVTDSTFVFDGLSTVVSDSKAFNNIQVAADGTLAASDTLNVDGDFTVASGAGTSYFSISSQQANFAGDVSLANLDNFMATSSTVVFDGTTDLTAGGHTFIDVEIGTASSAGNLSTDGTFDINGDLSVGSQDNTVFNITNDKVTAAGDFILTNIDTFTVAGSTVIFDGDSTVASASKAFNAITIGSTATVTASDNMNIDGALTIQSGGTNRFDISSRTVNAASTFNLTNLTTFVTTSSSVIFDGTLTLTSSGHTFNNIQIGGDSDDGDVTLADSLNIDGDFTTGAASGNSFTISSQTVNAAGDFSMDNLDAFTSTSSTVIFDGEGTLTSGGHAFNDVEIGGTSGTASVTTADDMDIDGALTVNNDGSTTWDISDDTVYAAASFDLANLDTFTVGSSTVVFNASATTQTVSSNSETYNAITVSNSATTIFDEVFSCGAFTNETAGSTLRFQQSSTFTIGGTLTLTGSGGNEIYLNSVDGASRFTWDVSTAGQTVNYVNVSHSEISSNSVTAYNSTDNTDTDSGESAPQWVFETISEISIATGRFSMGSVGGILNVNNVGFTPKAYITFVTKNTSDGTNSEEGAGNGGMISIGMTDGTRQFCLASGAEDDQDPSDVGQRGFEDAVVCNIDVGDGSQTVKGKASHSSFSSGTFTVNRTTAFSNPASLDMQYIAFGGIDLSVRVDSTQLTTSAGSSVNITDVGFEPDLVLTSYIGNLVDADGNANNDTDSISFGWTVNPDIQSSNNQFSIMKASQDNVSGSNVITRLDDTRAGTSYKGGAQDASYQITDFDSSGFSVMTLLADATTNEKMVYMALDMGDYPRIYSTLRTTRTSTGDDRDANAGFAPIFLMGIGSAVATTANINTDGGSMTIAIAHDDSDADANVDESFSMSVHDESSTGGNSNSHTWIENKTNFMQSYAEDGTIDFVNTITQFDTSGWTLDFSNAASDAYQVAYLAIGKLPASATITGTVYDSDESTALGAGTDVVLSINGSSTLQSRTTDANGAYQFTAEVDAGDVVTLFIDGSTNEGATVTVGDGNLMTSLDIYASHLILRHDNAGALTNTHLATADNVNDPELDAVFTMSGLNMTVGEGVELLIPNGHEYAPDGQVSCDDIDINGTLTANSDDMTVSGTWDPTGGSFSMGATVTVTFDSTGSEQITSNSSSFASVTFDGSAGGSTGTWTLQDGPLDVNGDLSIINGELDVGSNYAIQVSGGWTNTGTFTAQNGTVTLDGTSQSIDGSTTFYNLTKTMTQDNDVDYTLSFDSDGTQTISNAITLQGFDATTDRLFLRPDATTEQWGINPQNTRTITNVVVFDSYNANATTIYCLVGCTDGNGNSYNWVFGSGTYVDISGKAYASDAVTAISNDATIAISVDGQAVSVNTTPTSGDYTLSNVLVTEGYSLTIFYDGSSLKGVTVTESDGNDMTGINLYASHLTLRSDSTTDLTNTDLDKANNSGDTDIDGIYTMSSNELTVSGQGTKLWVLSGHTFAPGDKVTAHDVDVDGTMTMAANDLIVTGSFTNDGGTFSSSAIVMMTPTAFESVKTDDAFNDFIINNGLLGYWNLDDGFGGGTNITASDVSGYRNDGTMISMDADNTDWVTSTPTNSYKNLYSVNFDGADDHIIITEPAVGTGAFTVMAWVNPDSLVGKDADYGAGIVSSTTGENIGDFFLGVTSTGEVAFANWRSAGIDADGVLRSLLGVVSDSTWTHVAATWDGSVNRIYADGSNLGGTETDTTGVGWGTEHGIGRSKAAAANQFDGSIDDVRIYNRALTTQEISNIANGVMPASAEGTVTMQGALDIDGSFSLNSGTFDASGNNYAIDLAYHWNNYGGVFIERAGTVTMDGTSHDIPASETFYNIVKSSSSGTMTFGARSTFTITNAVTLTGVSPMNVLKLRSSSTGSQWRIDPQSTRTIYYIDVEDSENIDSTYINPLSSVNSGNTVMWFKPRIILVN